MPLSEKFEAGAKLELRSATGVHLASVVVTTTTLNRGVVIAGVRLGAVVQGELSLCLETGTHEEELLRELADAADELALGAMDQAEKELTALQLHLCAADQTGILGRDFCGLVISNGATTIGFEVLVESYS